MKKRLISLLLAFCVLLAAVPGALAAGVEGRDTEFFTDQYHAGLDFEDMKYVPVTKEEFLAAIDAVKPLIGDASNAQRVDEGFRAVAELFMTIKANMALLNIYSSQDTADTESPALYEDEYALYVEIFDPFIFLVRDILNSPCGEYFAQQEKLTQDDVDSYLEYGGMSDEEKDLNAQLAGIESEYWTAYNDSSMEYEYGGKVWDIESLSEAVMSGSVTEDQYNSIIAGLNEEYYAGLGAVFMKALNINTALAALDDTMDNYVDYAYEYVYNRGYDVETARAFVEAVREYVVPFADDVFELYTMDANANYTEYTRMFYGDYSNADVLSSIRPCVAGMSDELLETWDYMIGHGLYDIEPREGKADQGFTTSIEAYGSPFFFNTPSGTVGDFTTIIHEFGHYNNNYWHPSGWNDGRCSIDVAEVHSQALELLFTEYYDSIFGSSAPWVRDMVLYNILASSLINGALLGELEIYAYTTPDVTVDMICDKYAELCADYGVEDADPHGWLEVHHLTTQPMYYISYATSGIGALYFYAYALENGFDAAVDRYLGFVSQSPYDYFQDQFENVCGIDPMDPDFVAEIVKTLYRDLDLEARLRPQYFADVPVDSEYYDVIAGMVRSGVFVGDPQGTFRPYDAATRAETAQTFYNIFGQGEVVATDYFSDDDGTWFENAANWCAEMGIFAGYANGDFGGGNPITRQELTVVFCRIVELLGIDISVETHVQFADGDSVAGWAEDAMQWYYANGMLPIDENGRVNPNKTMCRYHLASYANNIFYVMYNF